MPTFGLLKFLPPRPHLTFARRDKKLIKINLSIPPELLIVTRCHIISHRIASHLCSPYPIQPTVLYFSLDSLEFRSVPRLSSSCTFIMASMAASNSDQQTQQPTCMNCQTSTTPLWRRDEAGQVLCNACGLFLKLHGRPRPISLKTDVIKSRNRVKTMRPGMEVKKKVRTWTKTPLCPGTCHSPL